MNKRIIFAVALIFTIAFISTQVYSQLTYSPSGTPSMFLRGYAGEGIPDPFMGQIQCCTIGVFGDPDAVCFNVPSEEICQLHGGAVQTCMPFDITIDPPLGNIVNFTVANKTTHSDFVRNLTNDVKNSNISKNVYNATSYDCDDFADDLEVYLGNLGYNSTFTMIFKLNATNQSQFLSAHALTDVHLPDGTIIYIEPQTGKVVSLDFDKDGKVGAHNNPNPYPHGPNPTEDHAKILVYDSKEAAENAGANID